HSIRKVEIAIRAGTQLISARLPRRVVAVDTRPGGSGRRQIQKWIDHRGDASAGSEAVAASGRRIDAATIVMDHGAHGIESGRLQYRAARHERSFGVVGIDVHAAGRSGYLGAVADI